MMSVDPQLYQWMRDIRRRLHRFPELGYKEYKTAALVAGSLDELGIAYQSGWAETGVVATIGNKKAGRHVALRADMDGLPLQDEKTTPYASEVAGVMHACGHDGHVAMLLGAAALLQQSEFDGMVSCIFQPAEEHGNGAKKLLDEGLLDLDIDAIFAGHIDIHYPTGIITVDEGIVCSSTDPFTITIEGYGGHAARPHEAKDAIVAGAYLVCSLQTLVARETDPNHSAVVTVGRFIAGQAHNVIAGRATLDGTLRTNDPQTRDRLVAALQRMVATVGAQFQVGASIEFFDGLPVAVNSPAGYRVARRAAEQVVGKEKVHSQGKPSLGGEDFAFYLQRIEGCLVRFGAACPGKNGPAHSATFDFDEQVLGIGAQWLAEVARQWLAVDWQGG